MPFTLNSSQMNSGSALPETIVVWFIDSLRRDFKELAAQQGVQLPALSELEEITPYTPPVVCGSHPTLPMRTDFLTSRLAFLDGRWEGPRPGEAVWLQNFQEVGYRTIHVGDNYMLWREGLGGYYQRHFDRLIRLEGTGADPTNAINQKKLAFSTLPVPHRDSKLERQFRTNLQLYPSSNGKLGIRRFVEKSIRELNRGGGRRVVFLELFQLHEPWVELGDKSIEFPGYFPYGKAGRELPVEHAEILRRLYVARLKQIDEAIPPLVELLRSQGVFLLVLSDHGIYLGEYGLFGKPKSEPIFPVVHRLYCRTNGKINSPSLALQPHEIAADLFGINLHRDGEKTKDAPYKLLGRNSPNVRYLQVVSERGTLAFGIRGEPSWFLSHADSARPIVADLAESQAAWEWVVSHFGDRLWIRSIETSLKKCATKNQSRNSE